VVASGGIRSTTSARAFAYVEGEPQAFLSFLQEARALIASRAAAAWCAAPDPNQFLRSELACGRSWPRSRRSLDPQPLLRPSFYEVVAAAYPP